AEDVAQDAFVLALERIGSCREPARFAGWLLTIVRNRALSWVERRKLRDVAGDERPEAAPAGGPRESGREGRLIAAADALSPEKREVVLLHDLEEWTHGEIATALGISEVMSRQLLFVARKALRRRLGEGTQEADHERR